MSEILISYDEQKDKFDSYALVLKSLLNTLIRNADLSIHSLDSRVKTRKSLEKKIHKKNKYDTVNDITDIIGIRIITHYADDVDRIAELVESEFCIDKENSIDKRISIEPEKFGYLSLHYIVSLNNARVSLKEYEVYENIKAEIQIRSILQHAWAEIEHDIGYKSATGLPNEIRRYFSRLAGLLELADDEFIKIKEKITARQQEVANELEHGSGDNVLDVVALDEFLNKSKIIDEISNQIEKKHGVRVYGRNEDKELEYLLKGLNLVNITTIAQLNEAISEMKDYIADRITWFDRSFLDYYRKSLIPRDVVLSYFCQIKIALEKSPDLELKFNQDTALGLKDSMVSDFFSEIRNNIEA